MTVHSAKGLEFDVVAVPDLSRSLLAGAAAAAAHPRPRASRRGSGCSCAGSAPARSTSTTTRELCEEAQRARRRGGLRLFHVAATRARERLILSGVVKPEPGGERSPARRWSSGWSRRFGVDRDADSTVAGRRRPSRARASTPTSSPREIAVRVNLPSPERAAELRARRGATPPPSAALGEGPPPLVERRPPIVPSRPLSYTAISAYEECAYRFYMERVSA